MCHSRRKIFSFGFKCKEKICGRKFDISSNDCNFIVGCAMAEYLMHDVFTLRNTKRRRRKERNYPQWSHACFTARDNNIEFYNNERRRKKRFTEKEAATLTVYERWWECKMIFFVILHHPGVLLNFCFPFKRKFFTLKVNPTRVYLLILLLYSV